MKLWMKTAMRGAMMLPLAGLAGLAAHAQEASAVSAYVDSSYLFLIGGLIVMFMAAGFLCLESGLVRSKNASMQSLKNIALFSIAGLMFWLVGYNMAYPSDTILSGICSVSRPLSGSVKKASILAMPQALTGSSRWCLLPPRPRSSPEPWQSV